MAVLLRNDNPGVFKEDTVTVCSRVLEECGPLWIWVRLLSFFGRNTGGALPVRKCRVRQGCWWSVLILMTPGPVVGGQVGLAGGLGNKGNDDINVILLFLGEFSMGEFSQGY